MIYIPRHFVEINKERILNWTKKSDLRIDSNPLEFEDRLGRLADLATYSEELLVNRVEEGRIPVRILSSTKLRMLHNRPKDFLSGFLESTAATEPVEAIVLHLHGGGYICQSSFVHQIYTRGWANNLHVPIFSVDYRKAPEHSYPCGLDDCFQAYMWLITYFDQVYGNLPIIQMPSQTKLS